MNVSSKTRIGASTSLVWDVVREISPTQCEFEWSASFEPQGMSADEAKARLEGFYSLGCTGLRSLFEK